MGLALVLLTSTFLGFKKTAALKNRAQKLGQVCAGLSNMAHLIQNSAGELESILKTCFDNGILDFTSKGCSLNENFLEVQDVTEFNNFINSIGVQDSQSEYRRTIGFITVFEKKAQEAQKNYCELSKLYNTLGFLIGLSICIFLI